MYSVNQKYIDKISSDDTKDFLEENPTAFYEMCSLVYAIFNINITILIA